MGCRFGIGSWQLLCFLEDYNFDLLIFHKRLGGMGFPTSQGCPWELLQHTSRVAMEGWKDGRMEGWKDGMQAWRWTSQTKIVNPFLEKIHIDMLRFKVSSNSEHCQSSRAASSNGHWRPDMQMARSDAMISAQTRKKSKKNSSLRFPITPESSQKSWRSSDCSLRLSKMSGFFLP